MPLFILHATSKDMSPCISRLSSQESMLARMHNTYLHTSSTYDEDGWTGKAAQQLTHRVACAQRLQLHLPLCETV